MAKSYFYLRCLKKSFGCSISHNNLEKKKKKYEIIFKITNTAKKLYLTATVLFFASSKIEKF